jgi:hypothetical protein
MASGRRIQALPKKGGMMPARPFFNCFSGKSGWFA